MLKLLLSIPRDIVACHIVPFLDLVSLTKLDSATMSHVDRPSILIHVFADVTNCGDEVCTYSHDLICWLMCRQVHISGLKFPISTIDEDLVVAAPAMANLKVLDLNDCLNVTNEGFTLVVDDTLRKLADNRPNLTKLHLRYSYHVTDAAIVHIVDRCKFLSDVQLDECEQIGDASMQALSRCRLIELSIKYCPRITVDWIIALIKIVGSSLKVLNVDDNSWVTENVVIALTKHCPNLERLHIDGRITSAAALDFICSHISTKLISFSKSNGACPPLKDAHIESIAARSTNLTSLIIRHAEQLTNKALISIGKNLPMLKNVTLFESLLLSYEGFAAVARGCRNIESFDVSYCRIFCDDSLRAIVQNCSKLTVLRINGTCVSRIGIGYISDYCANLTTIHLCVADAKEEDVMHMITSCTNLRNISYYGDASKKMRVLAKQRNIFLDIIHRFMQESDSEEDGESEEDEFF